MDTNDKITRAKIKIQEKNPFFAFLTLYLKFKEDKKKELPKNAGCGVNINGDFTYNKEFIDELTHEELKAVICHEVLHLAFLHFLRLQKRDLTIWNISTDISINQILKDNKFQLPDGVILTDANNSIIISEKKIINCNEKTAEQIYDELINLNEREFNKLKESLSLGKGNPKKFINENGGFDYHEEIEVKSKKEEKSLSDKWKEILTNAYISSKMAGKEPSGIARLIEETHKSKINWKALLNKYIINSIPYDYTFIKPHKKSISSGFYMPSMLKEKINIIIAVDLSGSIANEELSEFITEVIAISRAFRENITFRFLTHDIEVNNDYLIENGNIKKLKSLKLKGGGGTSHEPIFNYIKEKYKDYKLTIFLTDGESDLNKIDFNKYNFEKLFIISKRGTDRQLKNKRTKIISLK